MDELKSSQSWQLQLDLAKKDQEKWHERSKKIVKRYRDEREQSFNTGERKYNILWSNIRTTLPAVYSRKPQAIAERRYKDQDPVGRCASEMLQRCLQYEIDCTADYDSSIKNSVLDRLLSGRGVSWVRFEQANEQDEDSELITDDSEIEYAYEKSPCDYVYWEDFRHSPARTWEEVTWVARRVYLSRDEGLERFGKDFEKVPLVHQPIGLDDEKNFSAENTEQLKKAKVWEIWDRTTKTVVWIAEKHAIVLDERLDPLKLDAFFPCPKPLFATLSTDTLIPIPDYVQYQDQANELDELTNRIHNLVKACKVVGVYDASQTGVQRMLSEGVDNTLIPVDNWAAFGEKNGVKGVVDWMPLEMVIATLAQLYEARESAKQVIYEVTGLSDVIRGASIASETATAQQIKSQYASLRLKEMQNDVAMFASELLRRKAQIMCKFYRPETLVMMSGMQSSQDAQYIPQAIQLLQSDMRSFRIEIASDSLVELDEQEEKASRLEFLGAASNFLKEAIPAAMQMPEMAPVLGEMLLFGIRSFKAGRSLESSFESMLQQMQEKAKQPQQPPPDPEMIKIQAQQQTEQGRMQIEQARLQMEQQKMALEAEKAQIELQAKSQEAQLKAQLEQVKVENEAQKAALEAQKLEIEAQMEVQRIEFDRWKAELDASIEIQKTQMQIESQKEIALVEASVRQAEMQQQAETDAERMELEDKRHKEQIEAMTKPKYITRGKDGKMSGVE